MFPKTKYLKPAGIQKIKPMTTEDTIAMLFEKGKKVEEISELTNISTQKVSNILQIRTLQSFIEEQELSLEEINETLAALRREMNL